MKKIFLLYFLACLVGNTTDRPRTMLSLNILETSAFLLGKAVINTPITYVPIHLDGSYAFFDSFSLAFGAVYRFEDYSPVKSMMPETLSDKQKDIFKLWTNYHELFLMAGIQYNFFNQGNRGLYAAIKVGPGAAIGEGGYAISAVAQSEIGYSFLYGKKVPFFLDFAAGILINIPIVEQPEIGYNLSPLGWIVHRTIPIFRIGIGVAF